MKSLNDEKFEVEKMPAKRRESNKPELQNKALREQGATRQ